MHKQAWGSALLFLPLSTKKATEIIRREFIRTVKMVQYGSPPEVEGIGRSEGNHIVSTESMVRQSRCVCIISVSVKLEDLS